MAEKAGKDVLLKVESATPGTFTTVAALRTKSVTINSEMIDTTNSDSSGMFREMLDAAGIRSLTVSGSGVSKDATSEDYLVTAALAGTLKNWEVHVPSRNKFAGLFKITSFAYTGEYNGALMFDMTIESAGAIVATDLA